MRQLRQPPCQRESWDIVARARRGILVLYRDATKRANVPTSSVSNLIAMAVALQETLTAANAAHAGQVQVCFNLALGSTMASRA